MLSLSHHFPGSGNFAENLDYSQSLTHWSPGAIQMLLCWALKGSTSNLASRLKHSLNTKDVWFFFSQTLEHKANSEEQEKIHTQDQCHVPDTVMSKLFQHSPGPHSEKVILDQMLSPAMAVKEASMLYRRWKRATAMELISLFSTHWEDLVLQVPSQILILFPSGRCTLRETLGFRHHMEGEKRELNKRWGKRWKKALVFKELPDNVIDVRLV